MGGFGHLGSSGQARPCCPQDRVPPGSFLPPPPTGGDVRLFANGQKIGKGRMDHTVPLGFSGYAGMDIGRDNGGGGDRDYAHRAPFAFTGTIRRVVFDIKPHLSAADEGAPHEAAHHGHVAHGISG